MNEDDKFQKEFERLCDKIQGIISGQRSDAAFEALACATAIYIREYVDSVKELDSSITEDGVYSHIGERVKHFLNNYKFESQSIN